jgi:hypothetical protein
VVGDQIHVVSYDAFVADPDTYGKVMAGHMGIPWDDTMLKVEANRKTTATASAAQVRKPIYTASSGRWSNYARQLRPMTDLLEQAGIAAFETL